MKTYIVLSCSKTSSELIERYQDLTGHEDIASLIGYNRITSSYDIVWMAALALHATHEILQEIGT